jgi:hypothetical protein
MSMPLCTPTRTAAGAGELARRNHFLHERVDGGPVHRGTGAGDQRHRVEVPELKISAPCDVSGREDEEAAGNVEANAKIAAVEAVNEHAAEKRNK